MANKLLSLSLSLSVSLLESYALNLQCLYVLRTIIMFVIMHEHTAGQFLYQSDEVITGKWSRICEGRESDVLTTCRSLKSQVGPRYTPRGARVTYTGCARVSRQCGGQRATRIYRLGQKVAPFWYLSFLSC